MKEENLGGAYMGRGNTMIRSKYEGLYYVDRDFLDMYSKEGDSKNVIFK